MLDPHHPEVRIFGRGGDDCAIGGLRTYVNALGARVRGVHRRPAAEDDAVSVHVLILCVKFWDRKLTEVMSQNIGWASPGLLTQVRGIANLGHPDSDVGTLGVLRLVISMAALASG
jgi:hypothetical protein